jgi:hypothetical protein
MGSEMELLLSIGKQNLDETGIGFGFDANKERRWEVEVAPPAMARQNSN